MYDLYYWTTPNGHKLTMFLEEVEADYNIVPINIGKGEQFEAEFLKISPNNRIPALVDHQPASGKDSITLFESGAMLLYLAENMASLFHQILQVAQMFCSGCSGRWRTWAQWVDKITIS